MVIVFYVIMALGLFGLAFSILAIIDAYRPWIKAKRRNPSRSSILQLATEQHTRLRQLRYKMPLVKSQHLTTFYEQTLMSFETLLAALLALLKGSTPNLMSAHSSSSESALASAYGILAGLNSKIDIIENAMGQEIQGRSTSLRDLYPDIETPQMEGCYFCTKPEPKASQSIVKVKIEGKSIKVHSCTQCRQFLLTNKTIKILFFPQDGKNVHWSEYRDYVPNKSYWNLNDSSVKKPEKSQLRLLKLDR